MRVNVHRPIQGRGVPARRGVSKTTRRAFISALAGGLAAPLAAGAQQPAKVARIGFLGTGSPAVTGNQLEAFQQGLRDLGYVESRNIVIEYRWAEGRVERFSDFAVELVGLKVDVIVASSSPAALAAKNATRTIPIVFATAADPVTQGSWPASAVRAGTSRGSRSSPPRSWLDSCSSSRKPCPRPPAWPCSRIRAIHTLPSWSRRQRLRPDRWGCGFNSWRCEGPTRSTVPFPRSPKNVRAPSSSCSIRCLSFTERGSWSFANKNRLPAMYPHREYAETGGLMAYGVDLRDNFRRAATYVDKILKGAKPADLPVEQPTKFVLVINLKTAKALGLTIPPSLLQRADEVIQ